MWHDGDSVAEEEHAITINLYFSRELVLMLEQAGSRDVELLAGYEDREPDRDDDFVVFLARR